MLNRPHLSKFAALFLIVALGMVAPQAHAEVKKSKTNLYRDIFDQNLFYEGTTYLRLDRVYDKIFGVKRRSKNINVFDEVPDSSFFQNRHGRASMSRSELKTGAAKSGGPDLSGKLEVVRGKIEGLHPGFFVRDAKGEEFLLKFDPVDHMELATSAEVAASRFYHAIGYNVPEYTINTIPPNKLVPAANAAIVDDTGFTIDLTMQKLEEFLIFIPQDEDGNYRASASRVLPGKNIGNMSFTGRRSDDPNDPVDHRNRREIRALQVFASWLNNYDVRESNTIDTLVTENGRTFVKHYLIDFNTVFGSGTDEAKPPMFVHEHMMDYGEAFKAFLGLGFYEKPWQKRWRETGERVKTSPGVGYFDNRHFDPGKFKTQLPYYAFKDLTRADAFWATKIIMKFTDEDIKTMVDAGEYSSSNDSKYITETLIQRRDILGKYWFERSAPLDDFELSGNALNFKDLAVKHGFVSDANSRYHVDVVGISDKGRRKKITSTTASSTSIPLQNWTSSYSRVDLLIRVSRSGKKPSPYVLVSLTRNAIAGIHHED